MQAENRDQEEQSLEEKGEEGPGQFMDIKEVLETKGEKYLGEEKGGVEQGVQTLDLLLNVIMVEEEGAGGGKEMPWRIEMGASRWRKTPLRNLKPQEIGVNFQEDPWTRETLRAKR